MDLTHAHLLLNHFPTVGFFVAWGLFLTGVIRRSGPLQTASLVIFLGIALISIPTYVTGNAAAAADATLSRPLVERHESTALVALVFMELTGAFAWLGLWQFRRTSKAPAWNLIVIAVLSTLALAAMVRAAGYGGEIRHPELRAAVIPGGVSLARGVGAFVVGEKWMWPALETLHFIGLSLMFGVSLLLDLRLLGVMKSVPFAALHRLMPWGVAGFAVMEITGILFFVGVPTQYTTNPVFFWKLVFMMLTGLNVIYFTLCDGAWDVGAGEDAPLAARAIAASALVLVCAVMYCGRMLPFLGNAF